VLVDPEDKGSLFYLPDEKVLYNPRLQRRYEVADSGVAVMLVSDATTVDATEHKRLLDIVQKEDLKPTGAV
jgi:uncharacterized protein